jgi:prepilin-type N-terminal cleavage/methylation domain-containing protein/prepilin-type processing-associated H-X9-DG protein
MKRHGFTLTEVLITIAVIGILAAILFPVLARARGSARQSQCASHLAQIGHALHMYAGDWDGFLPPYTTQDPDEFGTDHLFVGAVGKYIRASEVWFCPADRWARHETGQGHVDHTVTSYETLPFSKRRHLDGPWFDYAPGKVEVSLPRVGFAFDDIALDGPHNGKTNVLYLDCHVRPEVRR